MSPITADLQSYYKLHAKIYDATRWSFLFGRGLIIDRLAALTRASGTAPQRILEIGCGTGTNLQALRAAFPAAEISGIDLCGPMLDKARQKVGTCTLIEAAYSTPLTAGKPEAPKFDAILASYALSMFNPGYLEALDCAREDLAPGGLFCLVDFHDTRFGVFRNWMAANHVRMEGHLLPAMRERFKTRVREVRSAYGGVWRYLLYIGEK